MSETPSHPMDPTPDRTGPVQWLVLHLQALLYGGFWLSLAGYGLLAPPERVMALESTLVTRGWHLSLMAVIFGTSILTLYWYRMTRASDSPPR